MFNFLCVCIVLTLPAFFVPIRATISFESPLTISELTQIVMDLDIEPEYYRYVFSFEGNVSWGESEYLISKEEKYQQEYNYIEEYLNAYKYRYTTNQWAIDEKEKLLSDQNLNEAMKEQIKNQIEINRQIANTPYLAPHIYAVNTQITPYNFVRAQFASEIASIWYLPSLAILQGVFGLPQYVSFAEKPDTSQVPESTYLTRPIHSSL